MTAPPIAVTEPEWQIITRILTEHVADKEVWAFGSRARRSAWTYSDLDLAIISDKPLPFSVSGALAEDFSASDLPFRVDILDWATMQDSFRRIIERDKVVVQSPAPEA